MPAKTKTPQKEDLEKAQGRDFFQTPNYGTDIIVPFLNSIGNRQKPFVIWECAAGERKISRRLEHHEFDVISTDIQDSSSFNFLTDSPDFHFDCIVTNTPFSLKRKFYNKCLEYGKPFALLIPADYALWIIEAIKNGTEKIIPERRIDYITPNTLTRIHEGEIWEQFLRSDYSQYKNVNEFKKKASVVSKIEFDKYPDFCNYSSIWDAPSELLSKYSSSDFHSMWLTKGFNLGRSETFVELTNEMKKNI